MSEVDVIKIVYALILQVMPEFPWLRYAVHDDYTAWIYDGTIILILPLLAAVGTKCFGMSEAVSVT